MDKYRIDSHKLIYHIERVHDWLRGKPAVCPVYLEVAPAGGCNHRCVYCGLDFMGYRPKFLDRDTLKKRLGEMGSLGVRSIMYAGEGEPLLHKDIGEIISHTRKSGIDAAVTTNAVFFSRAIADRILADATWIKVSINAGTKNTYSKIHRADPSDFEKVIKNMSYAAKTKQKNGYRCALGIQVVLLPENAKEVATLAKIARDIGMDYLVVKPYSQHPLSKTKIYKDIRYGPYLNLAEKLGRFNNEKFHVVFRVYTMKKWDEARRNYRHCLAIPFWGYIDAGGHAYGCSMFLTKERFLLGSIYKNTFKEIMQGRKRRSLIRWAGNLLNTDKCRVNCRMDEINRYLWELKYPPAHANFI